MSSSYPKHYCVHRLFSVLTAMLIVGSFMVIMNKDCRRIPLTHEESKSYNIPLTQNSTIETEFINHFYDLLQIYHIVITIFSVVLFLLGFINISPKQEDLRFGFHLLIIIIMGLTTMLTFYASYTAFHKPCHTEVVNGISVKSDKSTYILNRKDKNPLNAYTEKDIFMLAVTMIDALAGVLLLISTAVLCADAREEAIQDEYVARVRTSVY